VQNQNFVPVVTLGAKELFKYKIQYSKFNAVVRQQAMRHRHWRQGLGLGIGKGVGVNK
jgi:hypothetical protein